MSRYLIDAEAWGVLAGTMAGARCTPENIRYLPSSEAFGCDGLCEMLAFCHKWNLISEMQEIRMLRQLQGVFGNRCDPVGLYWPKQQIRPRITACRKLMRLCLEGKI